MHIDCTTCKGRGRTVERGFDGRTAVTCTECKGAGEIELTAEETAIMVEFLAACDAAIDGPATVVDVETFLRGQEAYARLLTDPATPMPMPVHPNMTAAFFDTAVKRAFAAELSISRTNRASTAAVNSATDPDVYYLVTETTCECEGHRRVGRCYHRAFYLWLRWVEACDAVALAATPARELVAA